MAATISGSGTSTLINLTTSGNTVLGDASTDTLNVGNGGLVKDSSGNVGIGTSSPQRTLHVENSSGNLVRLNNSSSANGSYSSIELTSTGGNNCQIRGVQDSSTAGHLEFYTLSASAVSERMRIDSSGNVGIGTSSPGRKLVVSNAGAAGFEFGAGAGAGSGNEVLNYNRSTSLYIPSSAYASTHTFYAGTAGGTRALDIDSSGNLLVGGTTAAARMYVVGAGTTNATVALRVQDSATTDMFYVRNDGLILTGSKSASPYNNTTGSAANMFVDSVGSLYRSTSSLKYKKNVQNAAHGLNQLLTLRPVTYEGKAESDAGKTFGGLIAEEVHEAGLTEFVQYAEDGSPDALAYGNMVSLCVKAIQEQQAIITQLQADVAALKGTA